MEVHNGEIVDAQIEKFQRSITTSDNHLVLVDLGPSQIVQRIVCIEPATQPSQSLDSKPTSQNIAYVFSTWTPCAVNASANTRPLPTMPKLEDAATAIRES